MGLSDVEWSVSVENNKWSVGVAGPDLVKDEWKLGAKA